MCGIVGFVNWGDREALAQATRGIAHRGPDDEGLWDERMADGGWLGLGSRRLAIRDLSPAGHMPMQTPDSALTITYNGEVYNYPALRRELEAKGYRFRSGSDTEAILYLYEEYGPACARRLNGMFAFAIWDRPRQQLFVARDHFGIKPLYFCHDGARFAFASEIKSLLQLPDLPRRMDLRALDEFLSFLWVPSARTMFEGIQRLEPGHSLCWRQGRLEQSQFWDLTFPAADHRFTGSETELAADLRERFIASVRSQLVSDVPLGAFLSAGLDSSSIVAAMAGASAQPTRTFTISFPPNYRRGEVTLDDTAVAQRTAAHFGCHHTDIRVEPDVVDLLPKLVWHMDEPVADPAIITAYLVNREARRDVTVLLSGVGGDELFAGYRKHQAHFLAERYRRLPALARRRLIEPAIGALPALRGTPLKGYVRLAKKMARSGSLPPRDRFVMDSIYLTEAHKARLLTPATRARLNGGDARQTHLAHLDRMDHADFLNQMLYLDSKLFMVNLNLLYNDKMSMASSVEVRVPFLDWELAEWVAWNVPPELKLHRGTTKHILREAMRPLLPAEVLTQKKAGFGAPVDFWVANDLREMVDDLLHERALRERGLFDPAAVGQLIADHRSGRADWSMQVWQLLTLELWMREFMDGSRLSPSPGVR